MKTPHEPLTPEERALAQSLSRLGPHGGPSPDLDARILGAARAAVQEAPASRGGAVRSSRRRWPLGMGVAASVLLAAGIAWQLRPTHQMQAASEVPVLARHETAVMSPPLDQAIDAAAAPEADVAAAAAAVESYEPPAPAKNLAPPKVEAVSAPPAPPSPARKNAEAAARQEPPPKRGPLSIIPTVPGLPAPAEPTLARKSTVPQAFPEAVEDRAAAEEGALQQQSRQRALAEQQREQQLRSESERRSSEAKAAADSSDTLDAVMVTGSRLSKQDGYVAAPAAAPPPPPPAPAASAGAASPSVARNALRRTELQVPVDEDARLMPAEWLDRIRLRRDLGDSANALRSLQLFVQEHPFQRVPDDLRPLLGTP
ncbi:MULTISPECIES: hypothetical protein [unclassified Pseudoxanthomonas]|uniref:hypothetical protein n=1 Tax=unclassified Pseudoxanthomonas TaxID=2645906 RepID=UPI0008E4FA82|nr:MULTISPECIES: hypothetical protein [unclassified Pseudoxanthomonas]PPJ42396.1 hypothetical protein C0063_03680 [Pseudoxanthomonas sp. KAs_5_3]SFV27476.1 hypothetical protein SAMN05428990_0692 [Pseudoxanthomonas sp. YR558]